MTTYSEKPWLGSYDPGVPEYVEIPESQTFKDILEKSIRALPDRAALHFMGATMSFRQMDALSARMANFLGKCGLGPGDVIALHMPNLPQYLIGLLASIRTGTASTGVSMLLKPSELVHQINDSGAKLLITLDMFFEQTLLPVADKMPGLETVVVGSVADYLPPAKAVLGRLLKKIPSGKVTSLAGKKVLRFKDVVAGHSPEVPKNAISKDDPVLIQYTGGTTGLPKGVVLTHGNMVANFHQVRVWTEFEDGKDVFCSGFPFFHQAGQAFSLAALGTSNTQCLIPDPRNTGHIAGEIKKHKATIVAMVPTLYHMLMDDPRFCGLDFGNVRACISGAAPFSKAGLEALEAIVGKGKIIEVYGMTETSPLITANPYVGQGRVGSVGLPLPNTLVKVMDVETGQTEMPIGQEGELALSGPQVMARYHNKESETAHALRRLNGHTWLFTGDVVRMDAQGFVYICDRAKDMLNVGGFKVFSREVEEKLIRIPEVEFCAIVGVPNEKRPGSDIVKAVIQLTAQAQAEDPAAVEENIKAFCRENLAAYKVPKLIEFTDAIPLTAVGKVDKKLLR
ncbi:MAG: AMP-binding protein [Thermodesulfobacteriota bacterium]